MTGARWDRRRWFFLLGANALLLVSVWAAPSPAVPGPLRMLAAALPVLVLPGAAWLGLFRARSLDASRLALAVVGLSSLAGLGSLAAQAAVPGEPSATVATVWTAMVVNAGILFAGAPRLPSRSWTIPAVAAAAGFLVFSLAALHLVPPLEDHDMEVRGTAYGLATDLRPWFLTNRELPLQFSHPVLFNAQVAQSLIFSGEIGDTKPSYDSALKAAAAADRGADVPWMEMWNADYRAFLERPALVGTRAPAVLLSALILGLLADLVLGLTGSRAAGAAAALLYLSFPETLVRSAYAGYFAATVFTMLAAAMLFGGERVQGDGRSRTDTGVGWFLAAGALAALVDHKTVVLVLGVVGLVLARLGWDAVRGAVARRVSSLFRALDRRVIALGAGFTLATLAWWGYGLAVDSAAFVRDHLRMHIAHRMLLDDLRLVHDPGHYAPSMVELWIEFNAHTGHLFLPVAVVGIVGWIFLRGRGDRRAMLAAWWLAGMVAFTLTDWRQTKHLMNQLAPMTAAAVVVAWPWIEERRASILRIAAAALLVVALGFNLAADIRLARDFGSLRISGASDVDGW